MPLAMTSVQNSAEPSRLNVPRGDSSPTPSTGASSETPRAKTWREQAAERHRQFVEESRRKFGPKTPQP